MELMADLTPVTLGLTLAVTLAASFVKGATGFAMPMIMISGMGSFLAPELALAGLILPTLATNLAQALRDGVRAALETYRVYWRLNLVLVLAILLSAQLVVALPRDVLYVILGVPITLFAVSQLMGYQLRFPVHARRRWEWVTGVAAGFFGGFSGVWGPVIIAFLVSLDLPKREHVRVQGVCYLAGAVFLTLAHLRSGVLNAETIPFSAALILPAFAGLWAGFRVQDRLDQEMFRKATLVVLAVAGLNLVRRALAG